MRPTRHTNHRASAFTSSVITKRTKPTPMERYKWNQLATKVPKELRWRLKLHCVMTDVLVQDFVTRALREKLDREGRRDRRRRD